MTRILPDFIVIGAMKAGTTTLYDRLRGHPDIGMSREKETDFFIETANWSRGVDWYADQFRPGFRVSGEASPNYTKKEAFPGVPARAARVVPGARLIFLWRDPVDRAASHYRHAQLVGLPVPPPDALIGSAHLAHLIDTSRYAAQIDAWLAHFPLERFLFLSFDDLTRTPARVLSRVARHLGVADTWPQAGAITANSGETLSRLPPWMFRLRNSATGRWMKDHLSSDVIRALKGRLAAGPARDAHDLPPAIRAHIAAAVAEDAARFAALAGPDMATLP